MVMRFDKNSGNAHCHRGPAERFDELGLAAGGGAGRSWQLNAVSCIEHDRVAGARHDAQAAHIDDQIVVAERGARARSE